MLSTKSGMSRRFFFKKSTATATAVGLGSLVKSTDTEAVLDRVNTNSQPSKLKITDMRIATVLGSHNIVRIDTNQGISGYGDIETGITYAMMLKSRILGMNPCNINRILDKIRQFGGQTRQGGGVAAVDMAVFDLAGKAWGVPCWQLLGGKYRDKIRIYADAHAAGGPEELGKKLKELTEKRGYTFTKINLQIPNILRGIKGTISGADWLGDSIYSQWSSDPKNYIEHPFTGMRITEKGIKIIQEYCATVREYAGWEVPIATDHYGHFPVEECIKFGRALDQFNFAWYEDMVPWQYTDQYLVLRKSCTTPMLTGEDIFSINGFRDLFEKKAISICQPDVARAGGMLETAKINALATEHGIATAIHMTGMPFRLMASVHCAAAMKRFLVCEHHNTDLDETWYDEMVDGIPKPIVQDGYVTVPDKPGLGVEINEEGIKNKMQDPNDYFRPTPQWDEQRTFDRLWGFSGPKRKKTMHS